MTSAGHGRTAFRRPPRRQVPMSKDCSPGPVAEPRRVVGCDASPREDVARGAPQPPPPGSDAVMDELSPGKQRLMEKFFSPVRSAGEGMDKGGSEGGLPEKDAHQQQHRQQGQRHHPHLHRQQGEQCAKNMQTQGYSTTMDNSHCPPHRHGHRSTEHRHGHLHHPHHDHHHRHHQPHQRNAVAAPRAIAHGHPQALGPDCSSSSGSSSSSSSSSSSTWSSESSLDNETFLVDRKQNLCRPQHSQSCTDISRSRRAFEDEDEDEEGEDTKPLLEDDSHLYKSLSLERNLASRNTGDGQRGPEKPKRATSSNLFPTKGILKNRQGPGGGVIKASNFRKAKSMEALSHKGERTGEGTQSLSGGLVRPEMDPRDVEKKREEARQNVVKEKLQFSAFLNEITRRVLSPSRLSSLGVMATSRPSSPGQNSLRCPQEERRIDKGKLGRLQGCPDSPGSVASSLHSHCSRRSQVTRHQDQNLPHQQHRSPAAGSSPIPRHSPGGQTPEYYSDTSTSPENSLCLGQGQSSRCGKQFQVGSKTQLTDWTSTSPELSPHLPRHYPRHPPPPYQPHSPFPPAHHHQRGQYNPSCQLPHATRGLPISSHLEAPTATQGLEMQSSRSSSSQNTTSSSSEEKHLCHSNTTQGIKDKMFEADRIRLLQDQNKDLQDRLLQTSLRMEHMGAELKNSHQQLEAELQRTRMELTSLQDKFKRLQDSYFSTQQTNNLLEHKLCSVVQGMDGERGSLNHRITELTEELSIAKSTIQTLENINVPSLLQEALEKHLLAEEAATQFLLRVAPPPAKFMDSEHFDKPAVTVDAQLLGAVPEEEESDWSEATEVWLCGPMGSNRGHHGMTAWKKGQWVEPKAEGGVESESEGKEAGRRPPPCSFQIPHLQFTVHPETLPSSNSEINLAHFKTFPERPAGGSPGPKAAGKLGSPIRILSASLEEIHSSTAQLPRSRQEQNSAL